MIKTNVDVALSIKLCILNAILSLYTIYNIYTHTYEIIGYLVCITNMSSFYRGLMIQHIKKLRSERRRNMREDNKAWHGSICIFSNMFSKEFQTFSFW